jgi:Rha family phage regulatory protein
MDNLIKDQFGVTEYKGQPVVSSRKVAETFNKEHKDILESIRNIIDPKNGVGNFTERNFALSNYKDSTGRKLPEYLLTRDGFTLLAMGFTGKKAMQFKVAYIERFNQMESFIKSLSAAKLEFPEFTAAIMASHEEPKHYHFSNEINMINRIVLGTDAKGFKQANNIDLDVQSIRPYLSLPQIKAIESLQKFDIGLITIQPDYEIRKRLLTEYYLKLQSTKLLSA